MLSQYVTTIYVLILIGTRMSRTGTIGVHPDQEDEFGLTGHQGVSRKSPRIIRPSHGRWMHRQSNFLLWTFPRRRGANAAGQGRQRRRTEGAAAPLLAFPVPIQNHRRSRSG